MTRVPPYIETLSPYEPGKSIEELRLQTGAVDIIKLASNENALGPSPKAMEAIQKVLPDIHRYPDGGSLLKEALATRYKVKPENVAIGAGSDSLMLSCVRAFVTEGSEVVTSEGSFAQYYLMPLSRGAFVKKAPLKDYRYDLKEIQRRIGEKTKLVFLANPNNPTGTYFTKREWESFYESVSREILIVFDEAYFEFAKGVSDWPDSFEYRYDNVITLRTFSKAYGLAGIRLGYAIGEEGLIRELHKVKLPFEPSVVAQAAGVAALSDTAFLREYLDLVEKGRSFFTNGLQKMGLKVLPSVTNFVMVDFKEPGLAQAVFEGLFSRGIIVRWLKPFGMPNAIRITIGLHKENERCLKAIESLV